jgi:outer membrane protein TolC
VLAVPVAAQQAPDPAPVPSPLTLEAAIARATDTSHRLAELRAREAASGAVADQRTAARQPLVTTQAGYQRTNHVDEFGFLTPTGFQLVYPDVPDNFRTRIEMQWPIYTGGRLDALERAATAESAAAGLDVAAARADLKLEVTRAFWALVTAREAVRVVGEALKRVDAQLADVKSRYDAGFVPPNDVLTVETQRARQQFQLIEAQNQVALAEADLARLIGVQPGTPIEPDATLDEAPAVSAAAPASAMPTAETEALAAEARANRKDRAALETRIQSSIEREAAAAAGRLPTLSLVSGAEYARPNARIFPREAAWKPSWEVGVNVSWNAWDAGRTKAEVAEARALTIAIRERLAEYDSQLALEVRQRTIDLASSRAQLDTARQGIVSATEARRVVQERFTAGVATTTDLLDAQVALLQAELDRTRALATIKLALARLDRALGR